MCNSRDHLTSIDTPAGRPEKQPRGLLHPDDGGISRHIRPRNLSRAIFALCAVILLFVAMAPGSSAAQVASTPGQPPIFTRSAQIEQYISDHGAKETVEAITEAHSWPRFRRAVASGWRNWQKLVPELLPYTDHRTAESLIAALGTALPVNARDTLDVVSSLFQRQYFIRVCASEHHTERWLQKSIRSLSLIRTSNVEEKKNIKSCLRLLRGETDT